MRKILQHFLEFIKSPSDRKLYATHKHSYIKIFFTLFVCEIALTLTTLPVVMLLDQWVPLVYRMEKYHSSPIKLFFLAVLFVPFLEELIFRYGIKYRNFYRWVISRNTWRKYYRWIMYSSVLVFGLIHLWNYDNEQFLFYLFCFVFVFSQLTGGVVLSFIRVRLGFRYAVFYHALWNMSAIFIMGWFIIWIGNPVIDKNKDITLKVVEHAFIDENRATFHIERCHDTIYMIDAKEQFLSHLVDTVFGKGQYKVYDGFYDLQLKSEKGIHKDSLLQELKQELTIIQAN